jgi:hypothetical protein
MFSKRTCQAISGGLVGSMLIVAWSEFHHGADPADIHLITSAPLAPTLTANSTISLIGSPVHENAIIDAQYLEPADPTPLRLSGVTYPRAIFST